MPIPYRRWLINRLIKDFEEIKKAHEKKETTEAPSVRDIDRFTSNMMKKFDK